MTHEWPTEIIHWPTAMDSALQTFQGGSWILLCPIRRSLEQLLLTHALQLQACVIALFACVIVAHELWCSGTGSEDW